MRASRTKSVRRGKRSWVRSCSRHPGSVCCRPSKRSRTRAKASKPRAPRRKTRRRNEPVTATSTGAGGTSEAAPEPPFRILPRLDDVNREFWTGGAHGELRLWRCQDCGEYVHPPQPICPRCLAKDLAVEAVSGRATLT